MANRFDVFTAKAAKRDNNGFLTVNATPTRSGIFTYYEPDGAGKLKQVRELRHPDEVFSRDTLDSLNNIPYTIQKNHVSLINPNDATGKTHGFTLGDARREDDHSAISIKIIDGKEIDAIERKDSLELSNGYTCDVIPEAGEFGGEKYDARQTNIRYNHVARVSNARGGDTCRIRLDSKGAICGVDAERIDSEEISKTNHGESTMEMIQRELPEIVIGDFRADAEDVEFPKEYKGVVDQFKKREKSFADALKGVSEKLDSLNEDAKTAEATVSILTKENEDLKEAGENSVPVEKLDEAVEERAKHKSYAREYGVDENLSNELIRKEIVVKSDKIPKEKLDDQTWIDVAFGMLDHKHEKKKLDSKDNFDNHKVDFGNEDGKQSEFDKALDSKGAA